MNSVDRCYYYIHMSGFLYRRDDISSSASNFNEFEILPIEYFNFDHPYNKILGMGSSTRIRKMRKILFHFLRLNRLI